MQSLFRARPPSSRRCRRSSRSRFCRLSPPRATPRRPAAACRRPLTAATAAARNGPWKPPAASPTSCLRRMTEKRRRRRRLLRSRPRAGRRPAAVAPHPVLHAPASSRPSATAACRQPPAALASRRAAPSRASGQAAEAALLPASGPACLQQQQPSAQAAWALRRNRLQQQQQRLPSPSPCFSQPTASWRLRRALQLPAGNIPPRSGMASPPCLQCQLDPSLRLPVKRTAGLPLASATLQPRQRCSRRQPACLQRPTPCRRGGSSSKGPAAAWPSSPSPGPCPPPTPPPAPAATRPRRRLRRPLLRVRRRQLRPLSLLRGLLLQQRLTRWLSGLRQHHSNQMAPRPPRKPPRQPRLRRSPRLLRLLRPPRQQQLAAWQEMLCRSRMHRRRGPHRSPRRRRRQIPPAQRQPRHPSQIQVCCVQLPVGVL
jgi:hypothetical protein